MHSDCLSLPRERPDAREAAWYAVTTKRHREQAAQARLEHEGVATYLPALAQWPPPAVGNEIGPMFPCYLFVRATMPDDFYRVNRTPHVRGFVTFGSGPAQVAETVVSFLRSREGPDGIIRYEPLPHGRPVRIITGPFKGFVAVVEQRLTARQRVRVLLDLMQRQTRVELPEKWVRQA